MEALSAEYSTCVIEAAMTMFFCLYMARGRLLVQVQDERILIRMDNGYNREIYLKNDRFLASKPGQNRTESIN